jgi:hypothetical protein
VAIDLTLKRQNWINTGMSLLFGPQVRTLIPQVQPQGFYGQTLALEAWMNEGALAGFVGASPASPVVDSDFANFPNISATVFMAAVAALQSLNANYQTVISALVAIKP